MAKGFCSRLVINMVSGALKIKIFLRLSTPWPGGKSLALGWKVSYEKSNHFLKNDLVMKKEKGV